MAADLCRSHAQADFWNPTGVRWAPLLIWVLGSSEGASDKMAIGVSGRVRPLILGRLSGARPAATGLLGAGRGFIGGSGAECALRDPGDSGGGAQAAAASTWSSRLRRVWWQRRASLRAIDNNASCPSRRALTRWKQAWSGELGWPA